MHTEISKMKVSGLNTNAQNILISFCVWIINTGQLHATQYGLSGNFSITHLYSTSVRLNWDFNVTDKHLINGYEIFVRPLRKGAGFHHYRIADTLKGRAVRTVYDITYLQPGTDYELLIYALAESGDVIGSSGYAGSDVIGASDRIVFRTLSNSEDVAFSRLTANPVELAIVISIVLAWAITFGVFVHKWGTIRILQPRDYRWKHTPKNLETIKIVKRPTDSVIYRNYSQKLTTTMQERERKIERMSTMPNIKLDIDSTHSRETLSTDRDNLGVSALLSGFSPGSERARFREAFLRGGAPDSTSPLPTPRHMYPSAQFGGKFENSIPENDERCPLIATEKIRDSDESVCDKNKRNLLLDRRAKFRLDGPNEDDEEHMQMVPLLTVLDRAAGEDAQAKERDDSNMNIDENRAGNMTETSNLDLFIGDNEQNKSAPQ